MANASNTNAPTQFIATKLEKYAYRRFGKRNALPLLCLQHFTGTLDNWDPAVTDPLAVGREVILFESAGLGRSTGQVPEDMSGMAAHALAFVDALDLKRLDILGYSLGGMVAQQIALERPSLVHKMLLVGTAPEGGEDIMHMEKPELRKITEDPNMPGTEKLVKLFFAPSESSQTAGEAFVARLAPKKARQRTLSRRKRRDRSDQGLSSLGTTQWRALCQARQNHAAVLGRQWRLRQYDSCPQFLHVERASPKRHAVDLSRFRAWVVVPVSQVIRSASFAVSRFRRYQLKAAVALVILSCIRL
jgi:pimeloyl-ACP methyl ester carboxylesterase